MNENSAINKKLYEACVKARQSNKDDTILFHILSVPECPHGLKRVPIELKIVDVDKNERK